MIDLVVDTLRVSHMLAFAIGIGAAAFVELQVVRRFRNGIDIEGLRLLLNGHDLIKAALYALWATGIGLVCFRLLIEGGAPSPKLFAKLVVVSVLTWNMIIIDRFVIPEIFVFEDLSLSDIPTGLLAQFGAIAGFSAGCWMSALLLGGFGQLASMSTPEIACILLPLIAAATIAGVLVALTSRWQIRARDRGMLVPGE